MLRKLVDYVVISYSLVLYIFYGKMVGGCLSWLVLYTRTLYVVLVGMCFPWYECLNLSDLVFWKVNV